VDPPIFVFQGDELSVFASAETAQARLEWLGVEDDVYEAFDSRGRRLWLGVVETERRLRGFPVVERSVSIEPAEQRPSHQADLRARLIHYLGLFDLDSGYLGTAALADLVRLTAERQGL
jgi:hypothetical protein